MIRSLLFLAAGAVVFGVGMQQLLTLHHGAPGQAASPRPGRGRHRTGGPHGRRSTSVQAEVAAAVQGLNYVFTPDTVAIQAGGTVTWVNQTAAPHTVSSLVRGQFGRRLAGYGRVRLTFRTPGTYRYYCAFHPYMLGTVVVRP